MLTTSVVPTWLGVIGVPIGIALLASATEFMGRNERDGWPLMGKVVPVAYIVWSLWLVTTGVVIAL